jgi:hypothetical protein
MAWDVRNNGSDVVRAGYGRLFNAVMSGTPGAETVTLRQCSVNIANPSYPDPYQGRTPASVCALGANISIVDDKMVNPYSDMYNVGFSHQLGADMAVNADGVYTKSNVQRESTDQQPVWSAPGVAARRSCGPIPRGQHPQVQSVGWQKYDVDSFASRSGCRTGTSTRWRTRWRR